jgi:YD repeat-containing protein
VYDKAGRLLSISDPDSSYTYTYDNDDRLTLVDNAGTPGSPHVVLTVGYDANGNRTSFATSINGVWQFSNVYAYDPLDRMTTITQSTAGGGVDKQVTYQYDKAGNRTTIGRTANAGGTLSIADTTLSYDNDDKLLSMTHSRGGTTIAGYGWTYCQRARTIDPPASAEI